MEEDLKVGRRSSDDLRLAARLVEQAMETLDRRSHICECCGLRVRENFAQSVAYDQLVAVAGKLRRFASELDQEREPDGATAVA